MKVVTIFDWLNFVRPERPREGGLRWGRKCLAPPYYSQRAVFASLRALFIISLVRAELPELNWLIDWLKHITISDLEVHESRSDSLYVTGEQLSASQDFAESRQWRVDELYSLDGVVAFQHHKRVNWRLGAGTSATLAAGQRRQFGVDQVLILANDKQTNSFNGP